MSEAHQTQTSGLGGLTLIGRDSRSGLSTAKANNFGNSNSPFSNELKRATQDVKQQVDEAETPPNQTDAKGGKTPTLTSAGDVVQKVENDDQSSRSLSKTDDTPIVASVEAQPTVVRPTTFAMKSDGTGEQAISLVAGNIAERQKSVEPDTVAVSTTPRLVGALNSAEAIGTNTVSTSAKGAQQTVVDSKLQSQIKADAAVTSIKDKALKADSTDNLLKPKVQSRIEADVAVTSINGQALKADSTDNLLKPKLLSRINTDVAVTSINGQALKADSTDNLLTATVAESDASAARVKQGATQPSSVLVNATTQVPVDSVELAVKSDLMTAPTNGGLQTIAQLPTARALNAANRGTGSSAEKGRAVALPIDAGSNTSISNTSIELGGNASLITSAELARIQANAVDVSAAASSRLAQPPAISLEGKVISDAVHSQVTSTVTATASATNAKQVLPDKVQVNANADDVALINLPKQVVQQAAAGNQVIEPAAQIVGNSVSEATSNMFQALPGGIITAPIVQRSEQPANLVSSAPYTVPLMSPDADEALAGNVKWMMADGVKNAVVNIAPSGMGPISVQIDIENEQMNVSIIATQGATREALDAMLPRLRDQLGTQGLDSVRVDVSDGRSDGSRNSAGQQFGQARSDLGGNGQNNSGTSNDSEQRSNNRLTNETERQRVSDMQNAAVESIHGELHGQSLYDAYV